MKHCVALRRDRWAGRGVRAARSPSDGSGGTTSPALIETQVICWLAGRHLDRASRATTVDMRCRLDGSSPAGGATSSCSTTQDAPSDRRAQRRKTAPSPRRPRPNTTRRQCDGRRGDPIREPSSTWAFSHRDETRRRSRRSSRSRSVARRLPRGNSALRHLCLETLLYEHLQAGSPRRRFGDSTSGWPVGGQIHVRRPPGGEGGCSSYARVVRSNARGST